MENLFMKNGQRPNSMRRSGTLRRTEDVAGTILDIKTISESVINKNFPLILSLEKAWEQLKVENSDLVELIGQNEYNKCENVYNVIK